MHYDAILTTSLPPDKTKVIGGILRGIITEDTAAYGNHPFKDGTYIYTSEVKDVVEKDGKVYLITRNTVYLYDDFMRDSENGSKELATFTLQ